MWCGSRASGAAHERRRVLGTKCTCVLLLGWNRHESDLSVQQGRHWEQPPAHAEYRLRFRWVVSFYSFTRDSYRMKCRRWFPNNTPTCNYVNADRLYQSEDIFFYYGKICFFYEKNIIGINISRSYTKWNEKIALLMTCKRSCFCALINIYYNHLYVRQYLYTSVCLGMNRFFS